MRTPSIFRIFMILATAALLSACGANQPRQDFSHEGLELRDVRGLDEVWVRPGADFGQFQSILIEPVEVAFDPHWDPRRSGSRLRLPAADQERIRRDTAALFDESFRRELQRSNRFRLVETAEADTLVFKPRIVDLYISAPDDRTAISPTRIFVTEFGRASLLGELREAESGALIARISDREVARAIPQVEFADRIANEREGRRVFTQWARALVQQLERLGGG